MRRPRCYYLVLATFACLTVWAVAEPTPEELEGNQRRLESLRKHPEQLSRVRENLKQFTSLPEPQRSAVLKLDKDLHELTGKKRDRYWKALVRYADWLEQLRGRDPQGYQAIKDAPDGAARLALIKEHRDREWMLTQPKAQRESWERLKGEARTKYVADLRQEERQKHQRWLIAQRFWSELEAKKEMPCRLSDFGLPVKGKDGKPVLNPDNTPKQVNKVADYVNEYLMRYLTDAEKDRLAKAEGAWPDYPQTLVAIASKHPSALPPPRREDFPTGPDKLPAPLKIRLLDKKGSIKSKKTDLKPYEGQQNYGMKAVELATNKGNQKLDFEFWACNYKSLDVPMQNFVKEQLEPKLTKAEQMDLNKFDGQWPYYPQAIQEFAKKYGLDPPWHILPERDKWLWQRYRPEQDRTPSVVKEKEPVD